jgi:hypothetical protein
MATVGEVRSMVKLALADPSYPAPSVATTRTV